MCWFKNSVLVKWTQQGSVVQERGCVLFLFSFFGLPPIDASRPSKIGMCGEQEEGRLKLPTGLLPPKVSFLLSGPELFFAWF